MGVGDARGRWVHESNTQDHLTRAATHTTVIGDRRPAAGTRREAKSKTCLKTSRAVARGPNRISYRARPSGRRRQAEPAGLVHQPGHLLGVHRPPVQPWRAEHLVQVLDLAVQRGEFVLRIA
jgi:hypothetical protein